MGWNTGITSETTGLRVSGPRVPGLRDPGPRVPGLRDPGPGSVVSLVVPGFPSSHSWFPGARRLTRDSRIPAHFFVKKIRKNRKHRFFGLPGPK